jgi:hypothetical protein
MSFDVNGLLATWLGHIEFGVAPEGSVRFENFTLILEREFNGESPETYPTALSSFISAVADLRTFYGRRRLGRGATWMQRASVQTSARHRLSNAPVIVFMNSFAMPLRLERVRHGP